VKELIFTSAPRGLRPGSRGFTTVAASRGMSPPLVSMLERLSSYPFAFDFSGPDAAKNPVGVSMLRVRIGGQPVTVLSRRSPTDADYSGRSNSIAHHLVLEDERLPECGPLQLVRQEDVFVTSWPEDAEPRHLDTSRQLPAPPAAAPRRCRAWEREAGDAGRAGLLLRAAMDPAAGPVTLLYEPGQDLIELLDEAMRLLPVTHRWHTTFDTYASSDRADVSCTWRCVPAGTAAAQKLAGTVLDLTSDRAPVADDEWSEAARAGGLLRASQENAGARRTTQARTPTTKKTIDPTPGTGAYELAGNEAIRHHPEMPPALPTAAHATPPLPATTNRRRRHLIAGAAACVLVVVTGSVAFTVLSGDDQGAEEEEVAEDSPHEEQASTQSSTSDKMVDLPVSASEGMTDEGAETNVEWRNTAADTEEDSVGLAEEVVSTASDPEGVSNESPAKGVEQPLQSVDAFSEMPSAGSEEDDSVGSTLPVEHPIRLASESSLLESIQKYVPIHINNAREERLEISELSPDFKVLVIGEMTPIPEVESTNVLRVEQKSGSLNQPVEVLRMSFYRLEDAIYVDIDPDDSKPDLTPSARIILADTGREVALVFHNCEPKQIDVKNPHAEPEDKGYRFITAALDRGKDGFKPTTYSAEWTELLGKPESSDNKSWSFPKAKKSILDEKERLYEIEEVLRELEGELKEIRDESSQDESGSEVPPAEKAVSDASADSKALVEKHVKNLSTLIQKAGKVKDQVSSIQGVIGVFRLGEPRLVKKDKYGVIEESVTFPVGTADVLSLEEEAEALSNKVTELLTQALDLRKTVVETEGAEDE